MIIVIVFPDIGVPLVVTATGTPLSVVELLPNDPRKLLPQE